MPASSAANLRQRVPPSCEKLCNGLLQLRLTILDRRTRLLEPHAVFGEAALVFAQALAHFGGRRPAIKRPFAHRSLRIKGLAKSCRRKADRLLHVHHRGFVDQLGRHVVRPKIAVLTEPHHDSYDLVCGTPGSPFSRTSAPATSVACAQYIPALSRIRS